MITDGEIGSRGFDLSGSGFSLYLDIWIVFTHTSIIPFPP